jgi:(R,R)-butanediol dehydrogenase/meso-butanediol dehydrogenase/diacetyl reductase
MADKMRASLWLGPERVEFREIERPTPGAGESLVRVAYGGICGTDMMIYIGKHPRAQAPLVASHEFSGTVVEANGGPYPAGTRVAINPLLTCGHCYACRTGSPHVCATLNLVGIDTNGGFAEYAAVPWHTLVPVPDSVTLKQAAVIEPLAVAVHAVRVSNLKVGDVTAVLGAGPVGILTAQVARLAGARRVFVSELSPKRLEIARDLGFETIDVREANTVETVLDATNGDGVPVVFETAGTQPTIRDAADLARIGGQILQVGMPKTPPTVDVTKLLFKEVGMQPIRVYRAEEDFQGAVHIAATGKVDLDAPVTHVLPLERLAEGMELMHAATEACKILLDPSA